MCWGCVRADWTEDDKKTRTSEGNLVNVGNADSKGANVNRNKPRNSNDNLGVVSVRNSSPRPGTSGFLSACFRYAHNPSAYHFSHRLEFFLMADIGIPVDCSGVFCKPYQHFYGFKRDIHLRQIFSFLNLFFGVIGDDALGQNLKQEIRYLLTDRETVKLRQ